MTIVRLKGGLGNQMFQYAAGRAKSIKNKTKLRLDLLYFDLALPWITKRSYSLDVFNIQAELVKTSLVRIIIDRIFSAGRFQSPKYFEGHEEIIRKDFTLKDPFAGKAKELLKEIKNSASVGVHIRRGDYVGNKFHSVLDMDYYKRGLEHISSKSKIDRVYVFSDDIEWCAENLQLDYPTVFVGNEYAAKHGEGHMMLMSACKNFVIANSSFSWWAAWLSENPKKIVIAPRKWFGDESIDAGHLISEGWIRI